MPHFVVIVGQDSKIRHRGDWPWSVAKAGPEQEVAAVPASARQEAAMEASSTAAVVVEGTIVKVMAEPIMWVPSRNSPSHLPIHFRNQLTRLDSGVFIMVLLRVRLGRTSQQLSKKDHPPASN